MYYKSIYLYLCLCSKWETVNNLSQILNFGVFVLKYKKFEQYVILFFIIRACPFVCMPVKNCSLACWNISIYFKLGIIVISVYAFSTKRSTWFYFKIFLYSKSYYFLISLLFWLYKCNSYIRLSHDGIHYFTHCLVSLYHSLVLSYI